jgi:hypothetical protein
VTGEDYFHLPHAREISPGNPLRSYYYDLRKRVEWPGTIDNGLPVVKYGKKRFINPVVAAQFGLGCLQHFWDTGEPFYLQRARETAIALMRIGVEERLLGLVWRYPLALRGHSDWLSAMAQGQAAALLLRVGALTGDEGLMAAGQRAVKVYTVDIREGGVRTALRGGLWLEEYAIEPPPFTLNGFIVAALSARDCAIILQDPFWHDLWEESVCTLTESISLFDDDGWSLYDLTSRHVGLLTVRNLASPFYHRFHIELLCVLEHLTGRTVFSQFRARWQNALNDNLRFYRAVVQKALYRLRTPCTKPSVG